MIFGNRVSSSVVNGDVSLRRTGPFIAGNVSPQCVSRTGLLSVSFITRNLSALIRRLSALFRRLSALIRVQALIRWGR